MTLNIYKSENEVLENIAAYFSASANKNIATKGSFIVALSGGSSPKKLYELLANKYAVSIEWDKVFFFFGDERYVPKEDAKSNYLMAKTALFDPLNIKDNQIFAVDTSLEPNMAAADYAITISKFFESKSVVFDLVLLGLGDNSHTASLFPHTPILFDHTASVKAVFLKNEDVYRISFTAPLINNAAQIAFLVYGALKAEAVHHVIEDAKNIEEYPAQLIIPVKGELSWFLDEPAASNLKK